jgi:cytoskeletal protein RodZ
MKKLFSWLLRLGVLVVLTAIAWVVYVNQQQQSGQPREELATQPAQQLQQTPEPAAPLETGTQTTAPQPGEKTAAAEIPAADKEEAPQPPSPTSSITPAVTVQLPTTESPPETETAPAATVKMEQSSEEAPVAVPEQGVTEAPKPAETKAAMPGTGTEPAAEQPASLQEARMAAWKGQWDKAEAAYRKLQQEKPDDFNVHGELGNLY